MGIQGMGTGNFDAFIEAASELAQEIKSEFKEAVSDARMSDVMRGNPKRARKPTNLKKSTQTRRVQKTKLAAQKKETKDATLKQAAKAHDEIVKEYEPWQREELKEESLKSLFDELEPDTTSQEVLDLVMGNLADRKQGYYNDDPYLANIALDYIEKRLDGAEEITLGKEVQQARIKLNKVHRRSLLHTKLLQPKQEARSLLYDILDNFPPDFWKIASSLMKPGAIEKIDKNSEFLMSKLGAKLKNTEIHDSSDRAAFQETWNKLLAVRDLSTLKNFAEKALTLFKKQLATIDASPHEDLTPYTVLNQQIQMLKDRYPSSEKVVNLARPIATHVDTEGQIEALTVQIWVIERFLRDVVNEVPNRLYSSDQQKTDLSRSIVEGSEGLQFDLEDLEAEEFDDFEPPTGGTAAPAA